MHERGVIHTDIKIDNILICESDKQSGEDQEADECPIAKICDFGLSKRLIFKKQLMSS